MYAYIPVPCNFVSQKKNHDLKNEHKKKYRLQISRSRLNLMSGFGLLLPCVLENSFICLNHVTNSILIARHNSKRNYVRSSMPCLLT